MARFKKPTTIDPNRLRREITLISTQAYQDEIPEALELVSSGVLGLDRIVTTRVSLGDVVSGGFEELCRQPAEVGKVLVDCRGG